MATGDRRYNSKIPVSMIVIPLCFRHARHMRFLVLLVLLTGFAAAQSDASKMLATGLEAALKTMQPVPEVDRAAMLDATAALLTKHVTFRADGTASSWHTMSTRRPVEWKRLVVSRITAQPVTEADRLNGISKRYLVSFGCDAHRSWDTKTNTWGQWYPIGNVSFPSAIWFEWKNNAWTASETTQLKFFTPGPGQSIAEPMPVGKTTDLPPGMTRGR
jgi:hypothetical protein